MDSLVYAPQKPFGSGQAYVALSRVTRLQGLHVINNDSDSELPLVDVNASLFTAHNNKLPAVDREMNRLRGLTTASDPPRPPDSASPNPAPIGYARRTRPRRSDPRESVDVPPPRRPRRAS